MFPFNRYRFQRKEQVIMNLILKPLVQSYDMVRTDENAVNYDENTITRQLVWHLKNQTAISRLYQKRTIVIVMRPKEQATIETLYEPDIKFMISDIVWMEVEAKRIYEKNNWSASEYLSDEDGIGRFLHGKYSKGENQAGMIGYIQNGDLQAIILDIRSGLLKKNCRKCRDVEEVDKCILSIHYRANNEDIELYHLFFHFRSKCSND